MSTTADRRVRNSVRLPAFEESLKGKGLGKGLALAFSAILVAAMSVPTPATAFGIGFGGISIRIPGGFGGGRYHGHHHEGGGRHHGHHDEDDSDSSDELTKGKPSEREAVSKQQDLNPKGSNTGISDSAASSPLATSGPSPASSPLKPGPALASDVAAIDTSALYEHGPDLTPER